MNIRLTGDHGMTRRPPWDDWQEMRQYLSLKERTVYLYVREMAVTGQPFDMKTMGRDVGHLPEARWRWESHGALSIADIRTHLERLEAIGLVSFEDDEERFRVLGKGWE